MNEGATTVGSIDLTLEVKNAEANAKLDETKVKAEALGAADADVKVKTTGADAAIAKIAAVRAEVDALRAKAEGLAAADDKLVVNAKGFEAVAKQIKALEAADTRLESAARRSASASSAQYLAELRLEAVQTKRGRTDLQVAVAEETLARSSHNTTRAVEEEMAATIALTAAKHSAARAIAELAIVQDISGGGNTKAPANAAPAAPGSFFQLALAGLAAIIPLMAVFAGAIAAQVGAFMGMGAAGVLAIIGIKRAMAEGTVAGNQFAAGLHGLNESLSSLAQTASDAMLTHFQIAVSQLNANLPDLNAQIHEFSGILGTTGNIVLGALIAGFKILLPLFVQAGVYIESVAMGFKKWTTDGGLASFAQMASSALPQVTTAISSLLRGVLSIIGALVPLSTVLLGAITLIGNLATMITGFLGPAFPLIVAGVLAAVGAFKLFGLVEPMIISLTVATRGLAAAEAVALGPIGWVVAGLAALAAITAVATTSTQAATDATNNYTAAIQQDNGVIGANTKAQVANTFEKQGAFAIAERLGISTKILTEATLGNAAAQKIVNATLAAQAKTYAQVSTGSATFVARTIGLSAAQRQTKADVESTTVAVANNDAAIKGAFKAYNEIAAAQGLVTIKTRSQLDAVTALAASYSESVPAYLTAKAAQKQAEDQLAATTAVLVHQNDAVTLLNNAFTILNGGALTIAQAQTGASAAFNSLTDSIKTNGLAIDGNSKAAVANQQAVQAKVLADQAAASAEQKKTGSVQDGIKAYADSKTALENQLKAVGDLTPAMQAYIDKLYDVANFKPTVTTFDVDTSAADAAMRAFVARWNGFSVDLTATGSPKLGSGIIYKHAGGGTVGGIGSTTSDSNVVRLSRGEEIVKASSAMQARPFLKAFNANPQKALAAVAASSPAASNVIHNHLHIDGGGQDPEGLFKEFSRRLLMQRA